MECQEWLEDWEEDQEHDAVLATGISVDESDDGVGHLI